jgi:hypothetical protein
MGENRTLDNPAISELSSESVDSGRRPGTSNSNCTMARLAIPIVSIAQNGNEKVRK